MKNFKKMMAIVISLVMVLMYSVPMSALAETTERSISVSGLDAGDQVTFYRILEWADDSDEAELHKAVQGWYWSEPFATVFDNNGDKGSGKLYQAVNDKNQLIITDALAGDIARALNGKINLATVYQPVAVADAQGVATHTFTETVGDDRSTAFDGLYMAIVTPTNQDVVYSPIFVRLDSTGDEGSFNIVESSASYMNTPAATGAAKKSRVTLEKEAENKATEAPKADYNGDKGDTTKPGDVLDFKVTSTIPGYGATFTEPKYNLTDTLNGLKLTNDNFVVKVDGEEITVNQDYTLEKASDGKSYTIKLDSEYLKNFHVPATLTVEYKAEVQEGANTNVIKEKNTVELEFSHDPTTESTSKPGGDLQYKKDVTNHYTFSIDANNLIGPDKDRIGESGSELIKIGVDKDGNPINSTVYTYSNVSTTERQASPLAGAEFELLDKKGNHFAPPKKATSDENGRINFTGLDAGEYKLQETKAPAGYVKNSDPVDITIEATLSEKEVTEYTTDGKNWISAEDYNKLTDEQKAPYQSFTYKTDELVSYTVTYGKQASTYTFDHAPESKGDVDNWNITTSGEAPQSIANTKGVELPSTGGMGTTLFYIIGAILVILAGVLLVTRRRAHVEE